MGPQSTPSIFYFVTTNAFGSPSRLWAADFVDPSNPNSGGTIRMLLDGTEGQQMLDNMTVTKHGKVLMQEDVGNNPHIRNSRMTTGRLRSNCRASRRS